MDSQATATTKYVFHLVHDFVEFRWPELMSICKIFNLDNAIQEHTYSNQSAVFTCLLESDQVAQKIASRSILLKSISRLYYQAKDFEQLLATIAEHPLKMANLENGDTFKLEFFSFGRAYTQDEKVNKISQIVDALKFDERNMKVCLKENLVKHRFVYIEEWTDDDINNNSRLLPSSNSVLRNCYFGLFVCAGQNLVIHKYNLKDRGFIGNTSMDPGLSLIMANLGLVAENHLTFDPFVGTGSLLVGAAHFGAHVLGAELDYNLVHSRGLSSRKGQKFRRKSETIENNLKQYGLGRYFVDIMAADFSTEYINSHFKFDSIITDPPYGIREKTKKMVAGSLEHKDSKYMLADVYGDLLAFASAHLSDQGRLVYWLPVYMENEQRLGKSGQEIRELLLAYVPKSRPQDKLKLLSFSEQRLQMNTSRLLIVMEKVHEIQQEAGEEDTRKSSEQFMNQFRDRYFKVI